MTIWSLIWRSNGKLYKVTLEYQRQEIGIQFTFTVKTISPRQYVNKITVNLKMRSVVKIAIIISLCPWRESCRWRTKAVLAGRYYRYIIIRISMILYFLVRFGNKKKHSERKRNKKQERWIYLYTYICIEREKESEREKKAIERN